MGLFDFLHLDPAKALKHFLGYGYVAGAHFVSANAGTLVAAVAGAAPKTVDEAAAALEAELTKFGPEGAALALYVKQEVPQIEAAVLAKIGTSTPDFNAFVAAFAAGLQTHGEMLLNG